MDCSAWEKETFSVTCGQDTRRDRKKCTADDCDGRKKLLNRVSIFEMWPCNLDLFSVGVVV